MQIQFCVTQADKNRGFAVRQKSKSPTCGPKTSQEPDSYWNISACQEPIFINIINNVSSASSMKWVSLFEAESSVHSLPFFFLMNTSVPQSEEEKGRREGGGVQRGQGLQWRRKRRENDVWRSRNLLLHWDMIGFSLVQEQQQKKKIKTKEIQNGALKTKMRQEEGELLAGMWCWLLCLLFFFFVP